MSENVPSTIGGGARSDYDILHIQVYDKRGVRRVDKDFELKFIKSKATKKDITKRFDKYSHNSYNKYFDDYLIPTVISNTFITSKTISPYKELPKNTIIAFERPKKKTSTMSFTFGDYEYTKEGKEFNVKYIGKHKTEITTFPFGGFSEYKVNYVECYAGLKITKFDFSNLMMDRCVSTERMFYKCIELKEVLNFAPHLYKIPLSDMTEMFAYCVNLVDIDLSELNQSFNIYRIQRMFYSCISLKKIDISGLKLVDKYGDDAEESSMFANCYGLRELLCLKDQVLLIRESLPMCKLWVDERFYKKDKNKEENGKNNSISKKTKKLKLINTFFHNKIITKDLDGNHNVIFIKNKINT